MKKSGYDEVSLTSLSTADYSCIAPLIKKVVDKLAPEKVSLGVSSLRAYGLEENVLDDMQRVRASGVTFAPEAGSQRMRDVVNKNVTEAQLMETAERIFSRGWSSMKLYFMIGLPTEEESDVREIPRVGGRARAIGKRVKKELKAGGAPKVTVSVSTHVPKPHTPFQWCAMDTPESVHQKQRWLTEEAKYAAVDLRMHDCDTSWIEGVFARGDRTLSNVIERAYKAGARFDSWEETKKMDLWEAAFAAEGIDVAKYLGTIPVTARLPWDHIDVGLEEGFLAREYRKALKSRLSLPCGKVAGAFVHATNLEDAKKDDRKLVCYDCGVACDLSAMKEERLVYLRKMDAESPRPPPAPRLPRAIEPSAAGAPVANEPARGKNGGYVQARPPAKFTQGEPRRYRFAYTKTGPTAFLSHIDLIRALPRAFRRLDLPLFYSLGFHPKPDMTFGPALSLGVSSLCEIVDVKITADIDPAAYVDALTEGSQDGLRFLGGVRLGLNDASVPRIVDAARYVVAIPRSVLAEHGGDTWLEERMAFLRAAATLPVVRRIDGIGKKVDVREFLRRIDLGGDDAREAVARAGLIGEFVTLEVDLEIRGSGAVKITEVVEVLAGAEDHALSHRAVRTAMGMWKGDGKIASPMELETVKKGSAALHANDAAPAPEAVVVT